MKRGGSNLRRETAQQSSVEPIKVVSIDGTNLALAKAELDILRSGRFTSNGEFDKQLGELGSKFDKTFRAIVPWFVHQDLSRGPNDVIEVISDYFIQNGLCNEYAMEVYLQISWKSDKVVIVNRANLNTYISNYRCGLWKLYKSIFLRPCHWDTNLALQSWWGNDRLPDTYFGVGEMWQRSSNHNHFAFDKIDRDLYQSFWQGNFCEIPLEWNKVTLTFEYDTDYSGKNLFTNFIDEIEEVAVEIKGIAQTMIDNLTETHASCTAYKRDWEDVIRAVDDWEQNPYDISRSFFDIIHMGLSCCQIMNNYVSETTVTDELVLSATQIEKYTNLAHKFGRQFRDLQTMLRTNHVWIFFAVGRSHKNDFWVVNPCGTWSYDPRRSSDYKPSTSPTDWTSKVSWTSMAWFVKLGWMILYRQNTTITLESSFKDDMVKFLGQKPTSSPLPPIEMFEDIIKKMFEQAFCSPKSKHLAWEKMLSVLYPFLSFPGGRDRTIFKLETLPAKAATKQATTGKTSASCKYNLQWFYNL